jgi:hypothetical protein
MPLIALSDWLRLVERHTGLGRLAAVRSWRSRSIEAVLNGVDSEHTTVESQAVAAAELALAIFALRPLRAWLKKRQAFIAAATAVDLLRAYGWSVDSGSLDRLGEAIERSESVAYLARRLLAARLLPPPDSSDAEVYVSVPISGVTATKRSLAASWTAIIEEELEKLEVLTGIRLFVRAPGLRERDPLNIRTTVRSGLHNAILHFVIGVGGGTPGLGIETYASTQRRRPVIWLVPNGTTAPQSIRAAAIEHDVEILSVASDDELRATVRQQVLAKLPTMRRLLCEKDDIPVAILELQEEMTRRWMRSSITPEDLANVGIGAERANVLLSNPFVLYHEASLSEIDALASLLGIDVFVARKLASDGRHQFKQR